MTFDDDDLPRFDPKEKRTRGWKWSKIRQHILRNRPLCEMCLDVGITRAADQIDHIVPIFKGGTDDEDNLQPICVEHHRKNPAQDLGIIYRPPIGRDGWPIE